MSESLSTKPKTPKSAWRRRAWFINPRFQLTFIGFGVATALVTLLGCYLTVRTLFWRFQQSGLNAGLPEDNVFFSFIREQNAVFNEALIWSGLVLLVTLFLAGVYLSHKVAGPLYRLDQHMRNIAAGAEPKPVKFRDGDLFNELVESYNGQLERLLKR